MRPFSRRRLPPVAAVIVLAVTACSQERAGDSAAFCTGIGANRDAIVAPQLITAADVEAYVQIYRDLAGDAPLEIDEHWDALVLAYETMSTVDPDDAESEQRALARMYATQPSAIAVHDWVLETCEVEIPLATVAGAPPPTTAPGTTPTTDEG